MQTELVVEGQTKLEVPELYRFRTRAGDYAPSLTRVFYNPRMEPCRDISVSFVKVLSKELGKLSACDPLAGVGARGIRYAKEANGVSEVIVNDRSREAFELIRRNIELNALTPIVKAHNEDANLLLWTQRERYDFVDIDPFASPSPFVEAACAGLTREGALALTATDTAPLSGTHPRTCVRRYGAHPLKTEYHKELGIRILIGSCQRVAGKRELALKPLLVHATQHYFRIYMRAQRGAKPTDEVLAGQGYVSHCSSCGSRILTNGVATSLPVTCECGSKFAHAGPLWLGRLMDRAFIHEVAGDLAGKNFKFGEKELVLLNLCAGEAGGPPTFYDTHELAKRSGVSPPKLTWILAELRQRGYFASRTHFSGTGFRTDAPHAEILKMLKVP